MKAEGLPAAEIAQYFVSIARRKTAIDEENHAANLRPLTPPTRASKPVPALKLGAVDAPSTPRNRPTSPMVGTPRTTVSAMSSATRQSRYVSGAPSTPGRQRSPGLRDSSFYREASHELKLQRLESATRAMQERHRLTTRQQYHRERSRSPTGSVTSARGNTTPGRERPALWEPKRKADLQPTSVEARQLRNTFGESPHRVSYLPRQVQTDAFRLASKQSLQSFDLSSAFHKFERSSTSRMPSAPPVVAKKPTSSPNQKGGEPTPVRPVLTQAPAESPPAAAPQPSPRLSEERAQRLLADFRVILESNGTRPEAFAKLSSEQQNAAFDEWRCPHTMRLVVRDAYQRLGESRRSPR